MNTLESFVVDLLQGKISISEPVTGDENNSLVDVEEVTSDIEEVNSDIETEEETSPTNTTSRPVEVRREFMQQSTLPCITLSIETDTTDYTRRSYNPEERLYSKNDAVILIHAWTNTEQQRESINNQIRECFTKMQNHHYTYCTNYNNGVCDTIEATCTATTMNTQRTRKHQCPSPEQYEYQGLMEKHGILEGTCILEPPFYNDEKQQHPPLLHSIFRLRASYEELQSTLPEKLGVKQYSNITIH